jgi:hypothetical protein
MGRQGPYSIARYEFLEICERNSTLPFFFVLTVTSCINAQSGAESRFECCGWSRGRVDLVRANWIDCAAFLVDTRFSIINSTRHLIWGTEYKVRVFPWGFLVFSSPIDQELCPPVL